MSLVTYLIPLFALVYGAVLLDERVTVSAVAGMALILAGVALGSGAPVSGVRGRPRFRRGDRLAQDGDPGDVPFLAALVAHEDVGPYLAAVRPTGEEAIRAEIDRAERSRRRSA